MTEYKKRICHSRAEKAAVVVKNAKVERFNTFYLYHKEIIDEFMRLQKEVDDANGDLVTATINTINEKFPPK